MIGGINIKILIVSFGKIKYIPYIDFYLNNLINFKHDISIINWERDTNGDTLLPISVTQFKFSHCLSDEIPLYKKIPSFLKYRRYAKRIIKNSKYDLIIVLHSTPAIMLFDILISKYKGRYVLDYRDYTYEHLFLYKALIRRIVLSSALTFISSNAFRSYMPNFNRIFLSHNMSLNLLEHLDSVSNYRLSSVPIIIRFWGLIRHVKTNISIIEKIANDSRFELHYHGRWQDSAIQLKEIVQNKNIKNVYFHGEYSTDEKIEIASKTDLILNTYDNDRGTILAMGNKYYDGIFLKIPQICTLNSFMGQEVSRKGLGLEINPFSDGIIDEIYNYYTNIKWESFNSNCKKACMEVIDDFKVQKHEFEKLIDL